MISEVFFYCVGKTHSQKAVWLNEAFNSGKLRKLSYCV